MAGELEDARLNFIEGLCRIARFWGFPKAMGAIYGVIYLSPDALTLDDLVARAGVSKGAASTNVRNLARLGMIHGKVVVGDRKDYYFAETDFWKIIKGILREREKAEFSHALQSVGRSLSMVKEAGAKEEDAQLAAFTRERLHTMKSFFDTLDSLVGTALAMDRLRLSSFKRMLSPSADGKEEHWKGGSDEHS